MLPNKEIVRPLLDGFHAASPISLCITPNPFPNLAILQIFVSDLFETPRWRPRNMSLLWGDPTRCPDDAARP